MPKIKELDFTEEQIDNLFQQLSDSLKSRLFKKWLDEMDTGQVAKWKRLSEQHNSWDDDNVKLAAESVLHYYQDDPEMTSFTVLDGEEIHESR